MSLNTTTMGDLLKRVYDRGAITELENLTSPLLSEIGEAPDVRVGGVGLYFPVNVEGSNSAQIIQEGQALPSPSNQVVKQAVITPKILAAQVQITGLGKAVSSENEFAFAQGFTYQMDKEMQEALRFKEGMLFRDGTGQLALINEASVPDTTTAVDIDTPGAHWLEINEVVDIFDTSNNKVVSSAKVVDVDKINDQVKFDTNFASSIANNYKIFKVNTQTTGAVATREMFGLDAMVDSSGTFLGISRSTYRNWQGNELDAGSTSLTEDILQRAENRLQVIGGHSDLRGMRLICHPDQRRKYLQLTLPLKQFTSLSLDAGYDKLTYNGVVPFLTTRKCPSDVLYMGDISTLQSFTAPGGEMQINDEFGGSAIKWLPGFDACVSYFREYRNYAIRKPNSWVKITNLTKPTNR